MDGKLSNVKKLEWLNKKAGKKLSENDIGKVLSVDMQRNGNRLATATHESMIHIWKFDLNKRQEEKSLISTINLKPVSVNVIRWSPMKEILAIAGDNGYVGLFTCISTLQPMINRTSFLSNQNMNNTIEEQWKLKMKLYGHVSIVCDLSWCPNVMSNQNNNSDNDNSNMYIASASYDNTICIWECTSGQLIKRISNHESFVKGISWDPKGEYIASQSDDLTLRIYSLKEDREVVNINEYFKNTPINNSQALRLDWCPDGCKLVAGNVCTKNGDGHLAVIVDRDNNWACELRGVRGAKKKGGITTARFCYDKMKIENERSDDKRISSNDWWYWATGGASGLVTIWREMARNGNNGHEVKDQMMHVGSVELCSSTVCDITWTRDNQSVIAVVVTGECYIINLAELKKKNEVNVNLNQKKLEKNDTENKKRALRRITPEAVTEIMEMKIDNQMKDNTITKAEDSFLNQNHQNKIISNFDMNMGDDLNYIVKIKNMDFEEKSSLTLFNLNEEKWKIIIDGYIVRGLSSNELIAVLTNQNELNLFMINGTRICLMLGYPSISMEFVSTFTLMTVLENGHIKMWDFSIGKEIFDIPMIPYIKFGNPYPNIEHIMLNEEKLPVVQLDNSDLYVYNENLKIWLKQIKTIDDDDDDDKIENITSHSLSDQKDIASDMITQNSANNIHEI